MSIATKTGDKGDTSLMYQRRVSKSDPRIEACGAIDELNAAIGLARAQLQDETGRQLFSIQENLIVLMGEVATLPEDLPRFERDGFKKISAEMTAHLDGLVAALEGKKMVFRGWALPGGTLPAASLDFARTVCRRAERKVQGLQEDGLITNPEILVYLNRLSDVLWLMARWDEKNEGKSNQVER